MASSPGGDGGGEGGLSLWMRWRMRLCERLNWTVSSVSGMVNGRVGCERLL